MESVRSGGLTSDEDDAKVDAILDKVEVSAEDIEEATEGNLEEKEENKAE